MLSYKKVFTLLPILFAKFLRFINKWIISIDEEQDDFSNSFQKLRISNSGSRFSQTLTSMTSFDPFSIDGEPKLENNDNIIEPFILKPSWRVGSSFIEIMNKNNQTMYDPELTMYIDSEEIKSQTPENMNLYYSGEIKLKNTSEDVVWLD